jgi:hypothetical protein
VRNAVIFAVDVETIQVGIAPSHGDLNGVMRVGDGVVAPQEQPTQRKLFLDGKEQALDVDAQDLVEVLLRNGAQRNKSSSAGVGENDIEMPSLLLDRRIESQY